MKHGIAKSIPHRGIRYDPETGIPEMKCKVCKCWGVDVIGGNGVCATCEKPKLLAFMRRRENVTKQ